MVSKEQSKNSELWEKLHKHLARAGAHTQYPHEILVRWVSINPPKRGDRALDIGFGSGANLKLLEDKGYAPYGIEVSPTAIKHAKGISSKFKLSVFSPPKIDLPDNYFSLVISTQALYYNLNLEDVLAEIWRVMKDKAYVYITFYGKNHWWIKENSKKIGPTMVEWSATHPAPTERGLKLRFFDTKEKYERLFKDFRNIEMNKYTYNLFGHHLEYMTIIAQKIVGKDGVSQKKQVEHKFKSFYGKQ